MRNPITESFWFVAFWFAVATSWIIIAGNSDSVPWGNHLSWYLGCGLAAGSALAVAHYRSLYAARAYMFVTIAIGAVRSLAYLTQDSGGPAAVWWMYTLTAIGGYTLLELYVLRLGNDDDGG